jgi:hypothetical protein
VVRIVDAEAAVVRKPAYGEPEEYHEKGMIDGGGRRGEGAWFQLGVGFFQRAVSVAVQVASTQGVAGTTETGL